MNPQTDNLPKQALTDDEILRCFDVMVELRPHLSRENFLVTVRSMEKEGYQLAFIEAEGKSTENKTVAVVAGYRITTNLFMGKYLYVDDLVTGDNFRSKGYGERMMNWLRCQAVEAKCNYLHLDSGTHRGQAHKFYFNQGLTIASYHFSQPLNDG